MKSGTTFVLMVIAAFASVISFFQINSAAADKHSLNGPLIAIGIASAAAAVYFLIQTIRKA